MTLPERRQLVRYGVEKYQLSVRQACRVMSLHRSVYRYQPEPKDDDNIKEQLIQLANRKPRWGFKKMYQYLRNQGHLWNHKRVYRVYCDLKLNLRVKPKKRLPARNPHPLEAPASANESWSLDFMHDSLANGRTIRTLNIIPTQFAQCRAHCIGIRYWVDDFNREALWIEVDTSIPSARVVRVLP